MAALLTLILFSLVILLFYIALSLGTELPSSRILASYDRKKQQSFNDLTRLFTDTGLIHNRLDDLVQAKLITRSGGTLVLTARGRVVWMVMEVYRVVFHRTDMG